VHVGVRRVEHGKMKAEHFDRADERDEATGREGVAPCCASDASSVRRSATNRRRRIRRQVCVRRTR
jgi:hypothetical protein